MTTVFTGVLGDVPRVSNQQKRGQKVTMNLQQTILFLQASLGMSREYLINGLKDKKMPSAPNMTIVFTGVLGDVPRVSNQQKRGQKVTMNLQQTILFLQASLGMSREYLINGLEDKDVASYYTYMVGKIIKF